MTPAAWNLVRRFPAWVLAATLSSALVPAETGHYLTWLTADAKNGTQVTDRGGVKVIVGPVVTLLDQN